MNGVTSNARHESKRLDTRSLAEDEASQHERCERRTGDVPTKSHCARRGVATTPEIDIPGHSLVMSQWRPQLMLNGTPDSLHLSYSETIPTIQTIWLRPPPPAPAYRGLRRCRRIHIVTRR